MAEMREVERLLRSALVPVEPSVGLSDRLERRLTELADAAMVELAEFDADAMRDPRNWGRPVAAALVGGAAAGALVLVRARQQQKKRQARGLRALERGARDLASGVQKRLGS